MPMLGMNQNAGKIISWLKHEGDDIAVGDPVMEVETDKAIVEVEAQASGVLTEVLYAAGSEIPVGHVVARIAGGAAAPPPTRAKSPEDPVGAERPKAEGTVVLVPERLAGSDQPPVKRSGAPAPPDRLLISPKARREAARRGIDLRQLARLDKGRLYHVADLEYLQTEFASSAPGVAAANSIEFGATADMAPTLSLLKWSGEVVGKPIPLDAVWAAYGGGSLGGGARRIRIHSLRGSHDYVVSPCQGLTEITPAADASDPVDLVIHDLSGSRLSQARNVSSVAPTLTLAAGRSASEIAVTLRANEEQLSEPAAMHFLDAFVRRVELPIRHLL
jgi:pyruvate/2-oxoglutarate dehydrogenase complex dihydrolipoamide acyltransferase (E2) component